MLVNQSVNNPSLAGCSGTGDTTGTDRRAPACHWRGRASTLSFGPLEILEGAPTDR